MVLYGWVLVSLLTLAPQQGAAQAPPASESPALDPDTLPVSISKIQRALSRPPAIKTSSDRPVFRVEVLGKKPTIEDILGPDYLRGPTPYGGMTHSEFLSMVTPKEFQGYSMFTNKEGMVIAATSLALQWALMKAVDKYKEAREERERERARNEVLDALRELDKARARAGLPPR
jgi:hypothetical protein